MTVPSEAAAGDWDGWDFTTLDPLRRYKLLTGLVVPRPIAWVTTMGPTGVVNAAPFSFFNAVSDDPPLLMVSIDGAVGGGLKDTSRNAEASGELVVNIVDEAGAEAMNATSASYPSDVGEAEALGLALAPSRMVAPPRLAASPAAYECRVHTMLAFGDRRVVLAEVLWAWTAAGMVDPDTARVDLARYHPVGRLFGSLYTRVNDLFHMPRPG